MFFSQLRRPHQSAEGLEPTKPDYYMKNDFSIKMVCCSTGRQETIDCIGVRESKWERVWRCVAGNLWDVYFEYIYSDLNLDISCYYINPLCDIIEKAES